MRSLCISWLTWKLASTLLIALLRRGCQDATPTFHASRPRQSQSDEQITPKARRSHSKRHIVGRGCPPPIHCCGNEGSERVSQSAGHGLIDVLLHARCIMHYEDLQYLVIWLTSFPSREHVCLSSLPSGRVLA